MKKLLLSSAAICGLAISAAPAQAQVSLELGGFFKGYGFYTSQDDDGTADEERNLDIVRSTEVHFGGETTLDNGLTVGVHIEAEADTEESFDVEESYAYFSGSWGRVNFGAEDGASYLLQVAAPSADANLDGIRQFVNPVNYTALGGTSGVLAVNGSRGGLDYDQDISGYADKVTYLSPIMNGFQLGGSYTPDIADLSTEDALNLDDVADTQGSVYEVSARYEGNFNNVGIITGAGYTHVDVEDEVAAEDRTAFNVGLDLDIGAFGIGASYLEDDYAEVDTDEETIVVGADYTTGPFKFGASYINIENVLGVDGDEADRYTGGVTYTYGPGMTLLGSVSQVETEDMAAGGDDDDATSLLIGTQINF